MKPRPFERIVFFLSAGVLLFLYGYGSGTFNWFPGSFLDRAVSQTWQVFRPPPYLSPRVFDRQGVRIVSPERVQPGFTLIGTHLEATDWGAGLELIDGQGHVVHRWQADPDDLFPGGGSIRGVNASHRDADGSYLFSNGDVLVNIDYLGVVRLDACGNVKWSLKNGAHHSLARADDGTFWVPISGPATTPEGEHYPQGYPGLDRPVHHDRLVHFRGDGEVLDTISVIDLLYRNDLVRYLVKARITAPADPLHVNDVEPLSQRMADDYPLFEAGDLVLSIRGSDLVLVFDPQTKIVKWHTSDPFVQQHDPDFIGDGWIGVFDNRRDGTPRGTLLGGSRILAVQPHADSVRVLFPTAASDRVYTSYLGRWQLLDNGNILLTEGRTGRVLEAGADGSTVWEWIQAPFNESYAIEITEGTRYAFTREQVAAWPCALPVTAGP